MDNNSERQTTEKDNGYDDICEFLKTIFDGHRELTDNKESADDPA